MDQNDRRAIDDLFGKLQEAERQSPPRDTQAEAYIADLTRRLPTAPYFLAQAVIVQEHALTAMNQRVQELEAELAFSAACSAAPSARPMHRRPAPDRCRAVAGSGTAPRCPLRVPPRARVGPRWASRG
jgi:hypothetical protein